MMSENLSLRTLGQRNLKLRIAHLSSVLLWHGGGGDDDDNTAKTVNKHYFVYP